MNLLKILQGYIEIIEMEDIPTIKLANMSEVRVARLIQFVRDPGSVSVNTAQKIIFGIRRWRAIMAHKTPAQNLTGGVKQGEQL